MNEFFEDYSGVSTQAIPLNYSMHSKLYIHPFKLLNAFQIIYHFSNFI